MQFAQPRMTPLFNPFRIWNHWWIWLYAVTLTALTAAGVQGSIEERRLLIDVQSRNSTLLMSMEESITGALDAKRLNQIAKRLTRMKTKQNLIGISLCDGDRTLAGSGPTGVCTRSILAEHTYNLENDFFWRDGSVQYSGHPIPSGNSKNLLLVASQDLHDLQQRWVSVFTRTFILTFFGCLAVLGLMASHLQQGLQHYIRRIRKWSRVIERKPEPSDSLWLNELRQMMGKRQLVVIANREPYIHQYALESKEIQVIRPASGLVTALEPVLRKSGGLWIAHGSGSADREVVDSNDCLPVPPAKPKYQLKRVWLTSEEEQGYYYGFANEGLWPLCHLAHTRPAFRLDDWNYYQEVNRKFAAAIPDNQFNDESLILVQDYHFALLPGFIRERAKMLGRPQPRTSIFWHIPWPNAETFGICPWNKELLLGMLGADVIGFHTQYHCNNFLESCNRYLEARIDYEKFSVTVANRETFIRAFPIGIDTTPVRSITDEEISALKTKYSIVAETVAVGVDRIDYTKGIVERIEAVERFLEKNPDQIGHFSLVQMGSPSRTHIPAYRVLNEAVLHTVERVNTRFSLPNGYKPVLFLDTHHDWEEIQYFYQLGNICMVTSLHDGMNLVAKEYVWCQRPDRGSLILSKFTGASRELTEAFIVNPYSIEEMADAIAHAIALSPAEKSYRMNAMKAKVQSQNAYQWASSLIRALVTQAETFALPQEKQDLSDNLRLTKLISSKRRAGKVSSRASRKQDPISKTDSAL